MSDNKAEDTPKNELVASTGNQVAAYDDSFFEGGDGLNDFTNDDFTIPFLSIIQALSKALQKNHDKYVDGAQQGNLLNSATRKSYDVEEKPVIIIPVAFQHRYVGWKPNNGGIAVDFGNDSSVYDSITPDEKFKRIDENKNEIVDTLEYYCLMVDKETGVYEPIVVPFSGAFAKKAKRWNNIIRANVELVNGASKRPPIYFYTYAVKTVPESNDKGSWYSWDISLDGKVPDLVNGKEIFAAAKALRESVTSGKVKSAVENPDDNNVDDEDSPF